MRFSITSSLLAVVLAPTVASAHTNHTFSAQKQANQTITTTVRPSATVTNYTTTAARPTVFFTSTKFPSIEITPEGDDYIIKTDRINFNGGQNWPPKVPKLPPFIDIQERHELQPREVGKRRRKTRLGGDTYIALINATPYRWKRVYIHQYQMHLWDEWPKWVEPGKAITHQALTTRKDWYRRDTAGEVAYKLQGTSSTMGFTVMYRTNRHGRPSVKIVLQNDLKTDAAGKLETIELSEKGIKQGGVGFFLAGTEGNFTSTEPWDTKERIDPPANWMHSLYPELGQLPLREIILPRSHHAAMREKTSRLVNFGGREENTVCQSKPVKLQLEREGVRVLDTRVFKDRKAFREHHIAPFDIATGRQWHGALGQNLSKVVEEINNFNSDYPGELIIWDFHQDAWGHDEDGEIVTMPPEDRVEFFELLRGLFHRRHPLTEGVDVTQIPLDGLFKGGKGFASVILRFHRTWKEAVATIDGAWPGAAQGFVTSDEFPVHSTWSNMYQIANVTKDQLENLQVYAPGRQRTLYDMQWIRTFQGAQNIILDHNYGLVQLGHEMMPTFRDDLWNSLTDELYPNWITMDGFDGGEMRGLVKAMNRCFVLRQCGDWVKQPRT